VPLKVREVIKLLEKNGWRLMRTKGDHRIFGDGEGRTTVYRVEPATTSAPAPTAQF
jgi:predicted RNA binding protein YcfA (HicA-like mRNA interferase family)